jgi:2-polyprenyl-3-methyl-5-hydroxy-6-metoxy-1,4-benzoquinol methylase
MDPRVEANLRHWDELVPIHAASRFYDVEGFVNGECALLPIEREELGDVSGKSLVHLQCHFGLDTLSWARRGARVTGVDFSPTAIATARALAERCAIDARFVESEVTHAAQALNGETFDVVFTSWGVLGWLPDLRAWARTVAALLSPGGTFYIVEIHPTMLLFDEGARPLAVKYHYFRQEEPIVESASGSYADGDAHTVHRTRYSWIFEISRVVNELIDAGLTIEFLREHEGTCSASLSCLVQGEDRVFRMPPGSLSLPLSFSLRARR